MNCIPKTFLTLTIIAWTYCFTAQIHAQEAVIVNGKSVTHIPRKDKTLLRTAGCPRAVHRTIDGTCNNLSSTETWEYGASDIGLERYFPADYADGLNTIIENRANPRHISNLLLSQEYPIPNKLGLSSMVFTWGQFLDHDITISPEAEIEIENIPLPLDEDVFTSAIKFKRSKVHPGSGIEKPRTQTNLITAWIDGSNVYGSELTRANWLRTFKGGKLKTSNGNLLPYNTLDGQKTSNIDANAPSMAGDNEGTTKIFVAGDVRASEQPGLTALHTIFVREHNRICDEQASSNLSDQAIYQFARKRVSGLIQKITYEEFLPAMGIHTQDYSGYNDKLNPNIRTEFSTAAYRLGHTMVTDKMNLLGPGGNLIEQKSLFECFFNPSIIENNGIESILYGLSEQTQEEVDPFITNALRNFLFPIFGTANVFGLDLGSLNIQRGRDHGLPDFLTMKDVTNCKPILSFSDINPDPVISDRLSQAYNNNLDDIDLWVGLLVEKKLPGSSFGASLSQILTKQFEDLRDGDFYYYENDPALHWTEIEALQSTILSDVFARNTSYTVFQNNRDLFFTN